MSQRKIKKLREVAKELEVKTNSVLVGSMSIVKLLKQDWLFLVVLVLGIFGVYFNSLRGDFVSDDYASITQDPSIANFGQALATFTLAPVVNSFLVNLFGVGSSVPFHVASLFFYVLICVLMYIFVAILFGKNVSRLATVLFSFHPVHVEAVSWISGRPYLLTTLFVLVGLISLLKYLNNYRKIFLVTLFIGFGGMLWSDRVRGFAMFLLVALVFLCFKNITRLGFNLKKYVPLFLVISTLMVIVAYPMALKRIETVNSGYNSSESVFYNPFFQYPTSMTKYLQLLAVPTDLTLYHTMFIFPVWLNWVVFLLYFSCLIYFFFKNRQVFFCLAFIFLASAPSMLPVKVSWLVAERYVFFGSLGFSILIGLILNQITKLNRYVPSAILAIIVSIYSIRTYLRNIDWRTNHNLWVNTCLVSPNSHNAWNNIGDDYDKLKDYENAIKGFTQSTIVKPNYADAYHNRANIFYKIGRLDLARDSYMTALSYSPGLYHSYLSLTQIDLMERRADLALQHSQAILNLQPENPQSWYVAGMVFASVGDVEKAKTALKRALVLSPGYAPALDTLKKLEAGKS